ncbi:MAG: hypothetical protein P0Y60_06225 [Candidatus Microbacterium colombiense]|nr:MAG: hypothetical protein P0Y60_06225 [Microbacterium sp.]
MTETPSHQAEVDEIATDARKEHRLVWQGLLAFAIVLVIVIVRELFLR